MARCGDHHRHDGVADDEAGRGVVSDLVDHAGRVHPRDVGRRVLPQRLAPRAIPHIGVGGIDRGGVYPNPQLTGPRMHFGQVDDLQRLRPAELDHTNSAHGCFLPSSHRSRDAV